jgi:VanZ family protein
MNGKRKLYVDQYGNHVWASSLNEMRRRFGGRVRKMYKDVGDSSVMVGYVIGHHWFTVFHVTPLEIPA